MSEHKSSDTPSPLDLRKSADGQLGPLTARDAALHVLADFGPRQYSTSEAIDILVKHQILNDRELGLTTELVMGVCRHRLTLTRVLGTMTSRGFKHVHKRLRSILMIAAYQLIWLDGIPSFAAVNEAVKEAKREVGVRGGRFVNAILRRLLREIDHRRIPNAQAKAELSVLVDDQFSCQFLRPVMPDPETKPAEYMAYATSHPLWLVSRWISHFGIETATSICRAGICRPPIFLRPNRMRTDLNGLILRLRSEGIEAEPALDNEAVVVLQRSPIIRSSAFVDGWFQPQDPTAMRVVREMSPSPGQIVIDLCAGPGTKTTQIAEMMNNTGTVLACDKDGVKLDMVRNNCDRLGHIIVRTVLSSDIESASAELPAVDWILVDAPCSNTGVLARRPEARYRVDRRTLEALSGLQVRLLDLAVKIARPQTRLMYSTCSLEPEENEQITTRFAQTHLGWRLSASQRTFPCTGPASADWRDGGYWAMWVRK